MPNRRGDGVDRLLDGSKSSMSPASDLEPRETIQRLVSYLADRERFVRVARAALSEPPRVRAMLGALGELADQDTGELRASLNPLSRFDFGPLAALPNARSWQAK